MHFLWFSYLKGQPWKHEFVAAGETARCHMSEKDELQSPLQQTECQHYCLLPWWSFMWEHLAHMPLSIPSSFSMCQKSPLSSDIPNTFPFFLFYMSPSAVWWLWLLHVGGTENAKAPTENWNQTSKIHQSSFNVRTTNQLWDTSTSSHFPVSCTTDVSEALPQKFMSFKEKERN